jgi:signal transduction histidine kinase
MSEIRQIRLRLRPCQSRVIFDSMRLKNFEAWAISRVAPFVLLTASVVLVVILAWQAVAAATSHRELAERVLRDYATFAAVECVRRATTLMDTRGYAVVTRALIRAEAASAGGMPSHAALTAQIPLPFRDAAPLAGALYRFTVHGDRFDIVDGDLPEEARQALLNATRRSPETALEYRVIHPVVAGRMRTLVFTSEPVSSGPTAHHLGFDVPADALTAWLREHVTSQPLLPPALATRDVAQASIALVVRAPDGTVVFRTPEDESTSAGRFTPMVTRSMSGGPQPSGMRGFSIEVAIAPSAAEQLIIGGLPKSRIAMLLGLLALCVGLAFAAALQIRRERRHALARHDFVTRTSHELRTPVARIRMFAETLLLDRVRTPEERQAGLQAMDRAARRLSLLIDNVMQFSRQDAGPPHLRIEHVDAQALVREVVAEFEAGIDSAPDISIRAPAVIEADIDREAFRQVLLNLLDNAWKYGGAVPAIDVELVVRTDGIELRIDDHGPGVPERERARIWQAFVRLDRDRRSSVAGTGIGLAVVRDLVAAHHGTCEVQTTPHGGARFIVTFPASGAR